MSCVDNQEEVGRESVCQARHDTYPGVNAHEHHGNHHHNHGKEGHVHRAIDDLNNATHRLLDILRRILHVDKIGWHTREHVTCPLRVLARSLAMLLDILRHAGILGYITLAERLTVELRREESQRHHSKYNNTHNPWQSSLATRLQGIGGKH